MKLYVDDVRDAPDGWTLARTVDEAKQHLRTADVVSVSLDHDMGACSTCAATSQNYRDCRHVENGYDLVMWMIATNRVPPLVAVHSMNPVGKARMIAALESRGRHRPESVAIPAHVKLTKGGLEIEEGQK